MIGFAEIRNGPKHMRDVLAERADEVRDRREVRGRIAAQRDERHVLATRRLDRPAADDAVRVGDEDHLEQQRWGRAANRERSIACSNR